MPSTLEHNGTRFRVLGDCGGKFPVIEVMFEKEPGKWVHQTTISANMLAGFAIAARDGA